MIKVAIPTHNRADLIQEKTLKLLKGLDFDITIFANPKGEGQKYTHLWYKVVEIEEFTTMGKLRKQILNNYEIWDKILMIDDDIWALRELIVKDGKPWLKTLEPKVLKMFIENGFYYLEKYWFKLFWIYPSENPFFMDYKISDRKFIIWCFMWIIKTDINFDERINWKEDYDFTLKNIVKFGWCLRFDWINTDNKYGITKGGLQQNDKRIKNAQIDIAILKSKRGNFIKNNPKRQNEILLNIK